MAQFIFILLEHSSVGYVEDYCAIEERTKAMEADHLNTKEMSLNCCSGLSAVQEMEKETVDIPSDADCER